METRRSCCPWPVPGLSPRTPGVRGPLCTAADRLAPSLRAAPRRAQPPTAPRRQRGGSESRCAPTRPCRAGGYRGARATAALVVAAAAAADIAEAAALSEPSAARRGRHCRPGGGSAGRSRGLDCAVPPPPPGSCGDTRTAAGGRHRCAPTTLAPAASELRELGSQGRVDLSALKEPQNHCFLRSQS